MIDIREALMVLAVAIIFFGIFYVFISLAMGYTVLVSSRVLCAHSSCYYGSIGGACIHKGNDIKIGE